MTKKPIIKYSSLVKISEQKQAQPNMKIASWLYRNRRYFLAAATRSRALLISLIGSIFLIQIMYPTVGASWAPAARLLGQIAVFAFYLGTIRFAANELQRRHLMHALKRKKRKQ